MNGIELSFLAAANPIWWIGLCAVIATGFWAYYRLGAPLNWGARFGLRFLRIMSLLILLFVLLEPMLTRHGESAGRPHLVVLVDRSSSMQLPAAEGTRVDQATEVLARLGDNLGDEFELDIHGFAGNLEAHDGSSAYPWEPRGVTAMGEVLEEVMLQQAQMASGGIIMLTDGIHTSGKDPALVARNLPVPVFSILLGDTIAPADLLLRQIRSQAIGYAGEPIGVRVVLENSELAGRAVTLRIHKLKRSGDHYRPEAQALAEKQVLLPAESGRDFEVPLEFSPIQLGLTVFAVTASVSADEPVLVNNTRLFAVDVREKKTRILYIESEPDWDFSFLRRTLDADTSLSYTYLVRRPDGSFDNYGESGAAILPRSSDDLAQYAAVILGKMPGSTIPAEMSQAIRDYVSAGGGLLLLGGGKDAGGDQLPSIWRDLLPVRINADRRWGYTSSLLSLTQSALSHGITGAQTDDRINGNGWENLPPVWIREGQYHLSPDAVSLLTAQTAHPAKEIPVFSLKHAGDGRVAMMSARGFWRWDFSTRSDRDDFSGADNFWKRTMRWISEPSQKERFRLNAVKHVFQDSEAISFSAILQDGSYRPVSEARIELSIEPIVWLDNELTEAVANTGEREIGAAELSSREPVLLQMYPEGSPGRYKATAAPMRPGMYRYQATAYLNSGDETATEHSEGCFWIEQMGPEFYQLASAERLPEALARVSGALAVNPDEIENLITEIPNLYKRCEVVQQAEIWNHWFLFVLLVLMLSIEWIIRRRRGLP